MSQLRILDLSYWRNLRSCPGVGDVVGLEVLDLEDCEELEELPNLERLSKLRVLHVPNCRLLKALPGLGSLIALQELRADRCSKLDELPDMSRLTNLEVSDLFGCNSLKSTQPGFGNLVALRTCWIPGAFMRTLPNLMKLTKFDEVIVDGTRSNPDEKFGLSYIDASDGFGVESRLCWNLAAPNVSAIELRDVKQDIRLANFSTLTALKALKIDDCSFERWPGMGKDMTLESPSIRGCSISGWDDLGRLGRSASETGEVDGHCDWSLPELQVLRWWHSDVVELPDLSHMPRLRRLLVNHGRRRALPSGRPHFAVQCRVDHMHLEILIFRSSPISELPDLRKFPGLKVLKIEHCHNLTVLTCSGPLLSLQSLTLEKCRRLVDIPSFDLFPGLRSVTVVRKSRGVRLNALVVEELRARCSFLSVDGNVYVDLHAGHTGRHFPDRHYDREDSEFFGFCTDGSESERESDSEPNRESDSLSIEPKSDCHPTMQIGLEGPNQLRDASPSSVQEKASSSIEFVLYNESSTESVGKRALELPDGCEVEEGQPKKRKLLTLDLFR